MSRINYLSLSQTVALIKAVGHERTVIAEGPMGIGKSAMYAQLKKELGSIHHFPGIVDCTQLSDGSLWMPALDHVRGVSRELPNERFGVSEENHAGIKGSKPVCLMFDEIGKAKQFVKDMCAPMLYERRHGSYYFPEGSIVFGTTNLAVEGLGDSLQPHLRNRIIMVKVAPPTQQEWKDNFAIPNRLAAELIAATEEYPRVFDSFVDYEPGGKFAGEDIGKHNPYIHNPRGTGGKACVTPRSLHAASDLIKKKDMLDDHTLQLALAGTLGDAFAKDLAAYIRFGRNLPAFADVIARPTKVQIPDNPLAQTVQVFQFITQAESTEHVDAVATYVERLRVEMQMLFVVNVAKVDSNLMAKFIRSKKFVEMMGKNRQFLQAA